MLTCLLLTLLPAEDPAYARPQMLADAAALVKPGEAAKFAIVDVRPHDEYTEGHIPGAVWVDLPAWSKAMTAGADRASWVKRIGGRGIGKKPVVVCGPAGKVDAARAWWILRYWGVEDVRLLDGGYRAWLAAGGKEEKGEVRPKPAEPALKAVPERLATRQAILEGLKSGKPGQVVDTRSADEYCGAADTAKRNGRIPGAKHLEWSDTLDPKTGKVKPAAELARLLKDAGIDPRRPATTYCQSGGRASVMAFVLELMGGRPARNYYRSWAEWGNDPDTPVERPKK